MFKDEFKKELDSIKTNPDLLDRTRSKIAAERLHIAHQTTKKALGKNNASRFFKIAAVVVSVSLAVTAGVLLAPMLSDLKNPDTHEKVFSENDETLVGEVTSTLSSNQDVSTIFRDTWFQDEDIVSYDNYEDIIKKIQQQDKYNYGITRGDEMLVPESTAAAAENDSFKDSDANYSETNVQVSGVDEADIIKNDGEYLYYLTYSKLYVFDIRDPEIIEIVCEMDIAGSDYSESGLEIFYDPEMKTLSLISSSHYYYYDEIFYDLESGSDMKSSKDPGISEDTSYSYPSSYTKLETYDVKVPSSPKLIRTFSQEGSYLSSRRINDTIYLITANYSYYCNASYDILPSVREDDGEWALVPAEDIYIVGNEYIDTFTVVSAIESRNKFAEPQTQVIAGAGSTVYSSQSTLYVTGTLWDTVNDDFSFEASSIYSTKILSFSIQSGTLQAKSAGKVAGTVLNQYSIDEYDGYLRIATTSQENWDTPSKNNIFVLDDKLDVYSSLEDLAPGESIYAARFDGDRIYLVTFVQVDPLFVIDASNPAKLAVLGELKIPGYSNYLHIVGDDLILGIGNAAKDNGDWVSSGGLKIALFDVSDPTAPSETSSLVYGISYGYSEAQYNPKALLVNSAQGLYGMPVSFDKQAGAYGSDYISGYLLVKVDSNGNLRHEHLFENISDYGSCRGAFAGDTLFLVTGSSISSFDMTNYDLLDSLNM